MINNSESIFETVISLLKESDRYYAKGNLLRNNVIQDALSLDDNLLNLLLSNSSIKKYFFKKITSAQEYFIFDSNSFINFINNKAIIKDNYTKYRSHLGLAEDFNTYLSKNENIVLNWPYKDCLLEGSQITDKEARPERFFNEVLSADKIDVLLSKKVLSAFKHYTHNNVSDVNESEDISNSNLLIKGNNLIALSCIREKYHNKVDVIYIDPPYNVINSQKNTFSYNNRFRHSTWLTWMKNRLEIAEKLLSDNGVLVCAIDDNEQANLGVLLKEIFSISGGARRDYDIHCITIVHNPRGTQHKDFSPVHEYAYFVIPKGQKAFIAPRQLRDYDSDSDTVKKDFALYSTRINEIRSDFNLKEKKFTNSELNEFNKLYKQITPRDLMDHGGESLRSDGKTCFYGIITKDLKITGFTDVVPNEIHKKVNEHSENGEVIVYPVDKEGIEHKWRYSRKGVEGIVHLLSVRENKGKLSIDLSKDYETHRTVWTGARYDAGEYGTKLVKKLIPECGFSNPKSLYTVSDCIYAAAGGNKNAVVLDFFSGSGTTAHAVLDLNKKDGGKRKFILIEQMDYIEKWTRERIHKVMKLNKEGEFIYLELYPLNQKFVDKIETANSKEDLMNILREIKEKGFISYQIKNHLDEDKLKEFAQDQIKTILLDILEKNLLYLSFSEIDDETYNIDEKTKEMNKIFYRK